MNTIHVTILADSNITQYLSHSNIRHFWILHRNKLALSHQILFLIIFFCRFSFRYWIKQILKHFLFNYLFHFSCLILTLLRTFSIHLSNIGSLSRWKPKQKERNDYYSESLKNPFFFTFLNAISINKLFFLANLPIPIEWYAWINKVISEIWWIWKKFRSTIMLFSSLPFPFQYSPSLNSPANN